MDLQYHSSQLTFSDQWYGPQSFTQRTWVRLPVLSHSHRQVLTECPLRRYNKVLLDSTAIERERFHISHGDDTSGEGRHIAHVE